MKAFVYDHGWSGAEIVFTENREEAIRILTEQYLPLCQKSYDEHERHWDSRERPNPWARDVKALKDGTYFKYMTEYDVVPGLVISTDGE